MSEEDMKKACKFFVEYGNRNLTRNQKEVIKQAIDTSKTLNDLLDVAIATFFIGQQQ